MHQHDRLGPCSMGVVDWIIMIFYWYTFFFFIIYIPMISYTSSLATSLRSINYNFLNKYYVWYAIKFLLPVATYGHEPNNNIIDFAPTLRVRRGCRCSHLIPLVGTWRHRGVVGRLHSADEAQRCLLDIHACIANNKLMLSSKEKKTIR